MIFSLTDETYSLFFVTKVPQDVAEDKFLFAVAVLDQFYWVLGSAIGALAGAVIPFRAEGIDFAMTALFIVIFTEQWLAGGNRIPAVIGLVFAGVLRLVAGSDNFILPSMICIMLCLILGRKYIEQEKQKGEDENAD